MGKFYRKKREYDKEQEKEAAELRARFEQQQTVLIVKNSLDVWFDAFKKRQMKLTKDVKDAKEKQDVNTVVVAKGKQGR